MRLYICCMKATTRRNLRDHCKFYPKSSASSGLASAVATTSGACWCLLDPDARSWSLTPNPESWLAAIFCREMLQCRSIYKKDRAYALIIKELACRTTLSPNSFWTANSRTWLETGNEIYQQPHSIFSEDIETHAIDVFVYQLYEEKNLCHRPGQAMT